MSEKMNWYAVRTQNNFERSVLEKLNLELVREGLSDILGKTMIPTEKVFAVKNGKKLAKEKILYPGYLFIQTSHVGEVNNHLKGIRGSAGFVRTRSGDINPLQEWEVKKMLNDQEYNDTVTPESTLFSVGEEIKVIDGAFTTFKGNVHSIDEDKKKLKVEVLIFSRPTMVELDFFQVERS
jgi:transcriptional antiterminator NusG